MRSIQQIRRAKLGLAIFIVAIAMVLTYSEHYMQSPQFRNDVDKSTLAKPPAEGSARAVLDTLEIKGRAPKTNYDRALFGSDWISKDGCDMRNLILNRDLSSVVSDEKCRVLSGTLNDPYTGKEVKFRRGVDTSQAVQIDHVVALNDAWQKGAQAMTAGQRIAFANDPLELLAVDGQSNQEKSNSDAATWLPPNKVFRCQYVARQIAIKQKYELWVTRAEYDAMARVLQYCPDEPLPTP